MSGDNHGFTVIGASSGEGLARAADFYGPLWAAVSESSDPIGFLDSEIATALRDLETVLGRHDSFDTLAFLRFASGPWDFGDVKESESQFENSQAAQDIVALTLVGLGLPRQPLTGENSGQPDIGKAMHLAATILRASQARAMLRSTQINQPLARLASEFMTYEISVRGRQYDSIASELNSALLGAPATDAVVRTALGFGLDEIRAVREAGAALLNERFFRARDRVGDAAASGAKPSEIDRQAFLNDLNLMLNECRLFGAVSPRLVGERAGMPEATAKAVLDAFSFARPALDDANPAERLAAGERPTPWGCIADGDEYLILNGFLGEDELRREIERRLIGGVARGGKAAKAWPKYDKRRANFAEAKTSATLATLLGDTPPHWAAQQYIGPVSLTDAAALGPNGDRLGVETRSYESDLLFLVDGVAICVEVKAGSVTDKARGGNAKRLAADLEKTLTEGNQQADRLATLISLNHGVWGDDGEWIDLAGIGEVHSVIVMLDDMGPLSLSMNELATKGVIATKDVPWIVSLHDLIVMSRTFDHAAQFLEYLRRRRGRKLATMVSGADELDMLMWFLDGGMYFDPDPTEIAAQLPVERRIRPSDQRHYESQGRVRLGTLTDPLDAWFYREDGLSRTDAPKPSRVEQPWIEEYLTVSADVKAPGWLRFGADLVGLSERAQRDIGRAIKDQCRRARSGDIERSVTTHGTTSSGPWLLCASAVPDGARTEHLPAYVDAKQYQTESSRAMLLLYGTDGSLRGYQYRGTPFDRTPERDAQIETLPLRSLKKTFGSVPPSARRRTRRLRGKGGGGRGRDRR